MAAMPLISYAENSEDILLWRALRSVSRGTYVDVGAGDPEEYSVTKHFYDLGWNGINVEPAPILHVKLAQDRPRDVSLMLAAGAEEGAAVLYEITGFPGRTTTNKKLANDYRAYGFGVSTSEVSMKTLTAICREHVAGDIHFLKVDVGAGEADVLEGLDLSEVRPWILVVDAMTPLDPTPDHEAWEPELLDHGYRFAYFDGANRYYVAQEHAELVSLLAVQPNVFDGFISNAVYRAEMSAADARAEIARLTHRLAEREDSTTRHDAESQLAEIYASTSWRVTRPLRWVGNLGYALHLRPEPSGEKSIRFRLKRTAKPIVGSTMGRLLSRRRLGPWVARGLAHFPTIERKIRAAMDSANNQSALITAAPRPLHDLPRSAQEVFSDLTRIIEHDAGR